MITTLTYRVTNAVCDDPAIMLDAAYSFYSEIYSPVSQNNVCL